MTVKYENEIYEYLKGKQLTIKQIVDETDYKFHRVWIALTQLEQKGLIEPLDNRLWTRTDEKE